MVATEYGGFCHLGAGILSVGGVDLNSPLPFKSACFDGVNLTEVIEHIENQAQLIREIARVLKPDGVVVISTPNVLNLHSRVRFLFTGFPARAGQAGALQQPSGTGTEHLPAALV